MTASDTGVYVLLMGAMTGVLGFLLIRLIHGVDTRLDSIERKIDALIKHGGTADIVMAELQTRLAHAEKSILRCSHE